MPSEKDDRLGRGARADARGANDLAVLWGLLRLVARWVPLALLAALAAAGSLFSLATLVAGVVTGGAILGEGHALPLQALGLALAAAVLALVWRRLSLAASTGMECELRHRVLARLGGLSPIAVGDVGLPDAGAFAREVPHRDVARAVEGLGGFYRRVVPCLLATLVMGVATCVALGTANGQAVVLAVASYLLVGLVAPLAAIRLAGSAREELPHGRAALCATAADQVAGAAELGRLRAGGLWREELLARGQAVRRAAARVRRNNAVGAALVVLVCVDALVLAHACIAAAVPGGLPAAGATWLEALYGCSLMPVVALARASMESSRTSASARVVLALMAREREVDVPDAADGAGADAEDAAPVDAGIAFRNVSLAVGDRNILSDVTLDVPDRHLVTVWDGDGEALAAVCALAMRYCQPDAGGVSLGGVRMDALDPAVTSAWLAYVGPGCVLAEGTIRQNLALGCPGEPEPAALEEALRLARAADLVESLGGLDVRVDQLPRRLTAGERQRLGLARALATGAGAIVLLEPTEGLDALERGEFLQAVDGLRGRRTVLLATRRRDEALLGDVLCRLDGGGVD
ncbi:MAG: hypothetical protein ACI38Z_00645 [Parafannyhessea sp.]|uniref:hypothetical protein n=1 Tax=Parafannyhessea sp. TaxID=2847324 RepID=UPI003F108C3E